MHERVLYPISVNSQWHLTMASALQDVTKHLQSDKQLIGSLAAAEPALMDKFGIDFWWADYTAPTRSASSCCAVLCCACCCPGSLNKQVLCFDGPAYTGPTR